MFQFLDIKKNASMPLYRQIENQFRDAILAGIIKPGLKLPASRVLAKELEISRPTIVQVYEYLILEGFFEARHGSGTFVSRILPDYIPKKITPPSSKEELLSGELKKSKPLSKTGMVFQKINTPFNSNLLTAFQPNVPAFDHFPYSRWRRIQKNLMEKNKSELLGYSESAGYLPLRRAIADYLAVHRGDQCDPEQILIVPGSHFAFHLTTLLLTNPGDKVWLEDPGPDNFRAMLKAQGCMIANIDTGPSGMDIDGAIKHHGDARLAFTMPSRHHPLGTTLGLSRRLRLLEWAENNNSWIVEDDYDSEFRYSGRPLASMRSIDAQQSVVYVGTFSKSLFPALRLAYMVLPEPLIGTFRNAMGAISRSVSTLDQATLARFIQDGHFSAYVRQMHDLYSARRDIFCQTAKETLSGLLDVDVPQSGINTIGWLPTGLNDKEVSNAGRAVGINSFPLSMFRDRPSNRQGLVMGFAAIDEAETRQKLKLLASVIEPKMLANR